MSEHFISVISRWDWVSLLGSYKVCSHGSLFVIISFFLPRRRMEKIEGADKNRKRREVADRRKYRVALEKRRACGAVIKTPPPGRKHAERLG